MRRVSMIPSLLTCGNFACGVISIILCLQSTLAEERAKVAADALLAARGAELLQYACFAIFIAMLFDMLDGRVARMTGSSSQFGAELDSLADGCSFGVAPAVIVTTLWVQAQPENVQWYGQVMLCGIVYAVCAILRLARYNVEKTKIDKNYFSGLPSPAAAGVVVSAVLFCQKGYLAPLWAWMANVVPLKNTHESLQMQARVLGIYMLVVGVLMFTRLRFVHLANRFLSGKRRVHVLVVVIFLLALVLNNPVEMLFIFTSGYLVVSVAFNVPRTLRDFKRELTSPQGLQYDPTDAEEAAESADEGAAESGSGEED